MSTDSTKDLDGEIAVVTGAGRGLGRAIAVRLASAGAHVVGLDLRPIDETIAAVEAAGGRAEGRIADVTDEQAVSAVVDEIVAAHGPIGLLVNNAGRWIDLERRPFWEIDVPEFDAVMEVNARSVFVVSKVVSASMREARRGRIVNFSSNTVSIGMPDLIHYVASKSAILGLSRSMATELAPYGITVNTVAPGLVPTDAGRDGMPDEFFDAVIGTQLLPVAITPEDIAEAVGYLCGPGGRMVTGQVLTVSGGTTMGPA